MTDPGTPPFGSVHYDDLTMDQARAAAQAGAVVLLPLGSVEEHGPHLPLSTDSLQPEYVAAEVARRTGSLVAPPLRYGLCEAARHFPGTLSIEFDTLRALIRDLLSELIRQGFRRVVILSGHAGSAHMTALRLAAREVIQRHRDTPPPRRPRVLVLSDYDFAYLLRGQDFDPRDGHAGTIETSRVLALRPDLVRDLPPPDYPQLPRFEVVPDPESYFPQGYLGDPSAASAEKGRMLNGFIIAELVKLVEGLKETPGER